MAARKAATRTARGQGDRMAPGTLLRRRDLVTVTGERLTVPDPFRYVHLQFRRFAGCPVCNLHLRTTVMRHGEIVAAGVREVVVFHSSVEDLRQYAADLPFALIADPGKKLYREFGVEYGVRSLLDPRAWLPMLRGVVRSTPDAVRGRMPKSAYRPEGGRFGLPADFLVGSEGEVCASKYGEYVYDQWSVDELLGHVATAKRGRDWFGGGGLR